MALKQSRSIFRLDDSIPLVGIDDIFGYKQSQQETGYSNIFGYTTEELASFGKSETSKPLEKKAIEIVNFSASIDALINNGRTFYGNQKDREGSSIGLAFALQDAINNIGQEGIIATMPYLIAGMANADKNNYLWKNDWHTSLSEEDSGIDRYGKLVRKGKAVVVIVHGGGILTVDRIMQAYSEGLTLQDAAKFSEKEFSNLLNGVLPSGESINLYTVDDIKRGIPDPFGRYAVWMPAEIAKSKFSDYHTKSNFMNNELVIARAGTLEYLDAYFEKAKYSNKVRNWHRFVEMDFNQSQGRILFVLNNYNGLSGSFELDVSGRFVGLCTEKFQNK